MAGDSEMTNMDLNRGALNGIGNRGGLTYRLSIVNGQGLTALKPKRLYGSFIQNWRT
jgi:hypothetical protein